MKALTVMLLAIFAGLALAAPSDGQASGSKIRIVLIGEDHVQATSRPYMRSTMIAAFEEVLVTTRRFDVISQSMLDGAMKQLKLATSVVVDPDSAILIGKMLQAKYVVLVRQLRMNYALNFLKQPMLDLGLQAQVIDVETNRIQEPISYDEKKRVSSRPIPQGQQPPEDGLSTGYSELVREMAQRFVAPPKPQELLVLMVQGIEVILDGGADVGVSVGTEFEVQLPGPSVARQGRPPLVQMEVVARLRTSRVERDVTYATILETYGPGQVRDAAVDVSRLERMDGGKKVMATARFVATANSTRKE